MTARPVGEAQPFIFSAEAWMKSVTEGWEKSGMVMAGHRFSSQTGQDWTCGSCGTLLLEDVHHVESWEFHKDGSCHLNGELVHQCPKGYRSGQELVLASTDHVPSRAS